jgi:aromatic-amino-acid transaminase
MTIITGSSAESKTLLSQIKRVVRTNYSSPPAHGAQIVAAILGGSELRKLWEVELTEMRERIHSMRSELRNALTVTGSDFSFIVNQKGMFSYSGLATDVVRKVRADAGVYIVDSGRICVAALNESNIGYVAQAIAAALG